MALLTGYAYERAGVFASMAVHFAADTTMTLLGVEAPLAQAATIVVQTLLALVLLATHRPAHRPVAPATARAAASSTPQPVPPRRHSSR
ncbi:hypothetical protein GCM10009863_24300 [Streptomyces axinellae]|uniref:CPBP family intramembrane metalloprotease n=2 Tax=Streptomyces axinellae TaxID=552788 RepID=A0ABN3PZJ1_9ACTN